MSMLLLRMVMLADGVVSPAVQNWIMSRWPPSTGPSMSCSLLLSIRTLVTLPKRRPSKSMLWMSLPVMRRLSTLRKPAP